MKTRRLGSALLFTLALIFLLDSACKPLCEAWHN